MKASSVLILAVAVATLVPVSLAVSGLGPPLEGRKPALGFFSGADSSIPDARGDASPVLQDDRSDVVPEVRGYHDIVGASVKELGGPSFLLTTNLAGNPNLSDKYETVYAWNIITKNPETGRDRVYTVRFMHFPDGFTNATEPGWYYAVFDNTANQYTASPSRTWDMPEDRVEYPVEGLYIGGASEFSYWVTVYVRVNGTSFDRMPEYIMDSAP